MKTNRTHIAFILAATLLLGACSESYLDVNPAGSTIIESQTKDINNFLRGSMLGIYSMMYTVSDHDAFGQRSIDIYTDLLCGDMALTARNYGWFFYDEQQETRSARSGYIWLLYYRMMYNINSVVKAAKEEAAMDSIAVYGLPNDGLCVVNADGDTIHTYTDEEATVANYYAEALTMRGYVYSKLEQLYCPIMRHIYGCQYNITNYPAFPLYDETNYEEVQPMAYLNDVFNRIETDLQTAIAYFDAFGDSYERENKLETDINVARGILAYSYLNKAYLSSQYDESMPLVVEPMTNALQYAEDVINSGKYEIIPNKDLTETGFNNVDDKSWMWGQNVSRETTGGLASFFGQVDIHSYSYAWAGDTKVIDKNLYDVIPDWDGRSKWFNDGSKSSSFKLCPDGKFFSAASPKSTSADDIDREWLSDNVFMRIESIYLIAAEAAYFLNDMTKAVDYLDAILSERLNSDNESAATDYAAFKATLTDRSVFALELYRNWRLEMWGEGYGLQTFRRLGYLYHDPNHPNETGVVYRGSNHLYNGGKAIDYNDDTDETIYTMMIPSSEYNYNPYLQ